MSDNPDDRIVIDTQSTTDSPSLSVSCIIHVVRGGTAVISPDDWHYTYQLSLAPITDAQVLYTVVQPSAYGTLTLDGVASSQFTHQDIVEGRVAYHHDGSATTDSMYIWAVVTEIPRVVQPYTPQFLFDPPLPPGTTQGAFYGGLLIHGPTPDTRPRLDDTVWGTSDPTGVKGISTRPFHTTQPNEVIIVMAISMGNSNTSAPAEVPIASLTYPGLTFTRLGGGSYSVTILRHDTGAYYYNTITTEIFYTTSAAILSSATMTATWTVTGPSGPYYSTFVVTSYYDLADLAHPFGTNPASMQMFVTNTVPGVVSLNTTAPDRSIVPLVFSAVAGDVFDAPVTFQPRGFVTLGGGALYGTDVGSFTFHPAQRTAATYGIVGIGFDDPPATSETLTDSELVFQPVFVDLSVEAIRRRFVSVEGMPSWMERDGSLPFNTSPAVYLTTLGPPLDFTQNNGIGGAFVLHGVAD